MSVLAVFRCLCLAGGALLLVGAAVSCQDSKHAIEDAALASEGTAALLVFGVPLFAVGLAMVLLARRKQRKRHYLQRHGHVVTAAFEAVISNHSVSINGHNPFVIVCHWLNPETSRLHVLESENIWFDPKPYINDSPIRVLMDKNDTTNYHVDISFLPGLAN